MGIAIVITPYAKIGFDLNAIKMLFLQKDSDASVKMINFSRMDKLLIYFKCCTYRNKRVGRLFRRSHKLIYKELDIIRLIQTQRKMKTILKQDVFEKWMKFKNYFKTREYRRVIDVDVGHQEIEIGKIHYRIKKD